ERAACASRAFTFTCEREPAVGVIWMRREPAFVFLNRSFRALRPGQNVCLSKHRVALLRSPAHGFAGEPEGLIVTALPFENVGNSDIAPGIVGLKLGVSAEKSLGFLRIASFEQLTKTKRGSGTCRIQF